MIRRHADHDLARDVGVAGDERAAQRATSAARELDGFVEGLVRHHRVHRSERLDVVRLGLRKRLGTVHQLRTEEGALLAIRADDVEVAAAEH